LTQEIDEAFGGQGEIRLSDGKLRVVNDKPSTSLTIDKWTSAFIVFMSVMLEKYRTRYQELLKYFKDIRLAAARSPSGWHQYDEQFRLCMAL
jgi:hypothetical protein